MTILLQRKQGRAPVEETLVEVLPSQVEQSTEPKHPVMELVVPTGFREPVVAETLTARRMGIRTLPNQQP